jgi:hypothetical protein
MIPDLQRQVARRIRLAFIVGAMWGVIFTLAFLVALR